MNTFRVIVALLKGKEGIENEEVVVQARNKEDAKRQVWGPEPIDYVLRGKRGTLIAKERRWFNTWPHFPQNDVMKRIVGVQAV